jgi:hypothetical protein
MRIGGFVQWFILPVGSSHEEWTTAGIGRDRSGQSLFVLTVTGG